MYPCSLSTGFSVALHAKAGSGENYKPLVSAKVGVLKPSQPLNAKPYRFVKKCVAQLLVRRLVADFVGHMLLREREIASFQVNPPASCRTRFVPNAPKAYEHRLEPKLEQLTISNSAWLRYLHGYAEAQ